MGALEDLESAMKMMEEESHYKPHIHLIPPKGTPICIDCGQVVKRD